MSTATERRREIGATIFSAMSKVDVDWTRENESIISTQAELDEMWARYSEGKASKVEVKSAYKNWVNAHKGGLF